VVGEEGGRAVATAPETERSGGSRWPFTYLVNSSPDQFKFGDYLPYPFFMSYATTCAKQSAEVTSHWPPPVLRSERSLSSDETRRAAGL
jgi:hypothetical protein